MTKEKIDKKLILIPVIIIMLAILIGVKILKNNKSFGHGYTVGVGQTVHIDEIDDSKVKYDFSVNVIDTKNVIVSNETYTGVNLNITNNSNSSLSLSSLGMEFYLIGVDGKELASSDSSLSESYMVFAPTSMEPNIIESDFSSNQTNSGYLYFETNEKDIESLEIRVYKSISWTEEVPYTSYYIKLK